MIYQVIPVCEGVCIFKTTPDYEYAETPNGVKSLIASKLIMRSSGCTYCMIISIKDRIIADYGAQKKVQTDDANEIYELTK